MDQFVNLTISGAVTGGIFALIAAGLILSYSATGIFNFSYGAIAFVSGLMYYELNTGLGWEILPAVLLTVGVMAPLLGLLLSVAVFRPLAQSTDAAKIMATVGLLLALPALFRWLLGRGIAIFDWGIPDGTQIRAQSGIWRTPPSSWNLGGVRITSNDVVMLVVTALISVVLYVLLRRTRLGLEMRAVVDRPSLASLRGIDQRMTSHIAWAMGSVLAALAGVAGAPFFGQLIPERYTEFVLIAATAAVVARLRSIPIGILAGLSIGILKNYVAAYADFASDIQGFENSVPFVLMFIGLLLMGRDRSRRGGVAAFASPPPDHLDDLPVWRQRAPWIVATVAFVAMTAFVLDDFWLNTTAYGLALGLVFLSFVLITGIGGMVSLAQASFVTCGGMVAGMLIERYELPIFLAILVAVVVAVLFGMVAALPSLRLGGLALALATLALALVGESVLFQWNWLRNGQSGWSIDAPRIGPVDLEDPRSFTALLMLVVGLAVLVVRNVARSSLGRAVLAVRDSEIAAASCGVSLKGAKLSIFCLSASFAGLGGVLLAMHQGNITNATFPAALGLLWLATAVLFGIRRPAGAVLAGLVTAYSAVWFRSGWELPSFAPSFLDWGGAGNSWNDVSAILFGLGAVQLARNEHGVLAVVGQQNRWRRDRRTVTPAVRMDEIPEPRVESVSPVTRSGPAGGATMQLTGVHAGYGSAPVLFGVDLAITPGRVTALVGPNGAGKSTLCAVLAGLVMPSSGQVFLDGEQLRVQHAHQLARRGVVLAPEGRGIFPGMTVDENLAVWLADDADRAAVYDRFPQLAERRRLSAGALSGGEQQLLTLAPLLQRAPAVLIADEPSLGLAPQVLDEVFGLCDELRTRGAAVMLVEEKASRVKGIADELVVLQGGRVVWNGLVGDITDEGLASLYMGSGHAPSEPS